MILIIDFGSQYNQLIARRVREHHVYCEIEPPTIELEKIRAMKPEGIILSGGPASIYEERSPRVMMGSFPSGSPSSASAMAFSTSSTPWGEKLNLPRSENTGLPN